MTVNEFIKMTDSDPNKWINYCEIIIKVNGMIELARPSHIEKITEIYCDIENTTKEELMKRFPPSLDPMSFMIQKYSLIAVWYDMMMVSGTSIDPFNRFQMRTINTLLDKGLIKVGKIIRCNEYKYYLDHRDEMGFCKNL